jgi:hypothetical protein
VPLAALVAGAIAAGGAGCTSASSASSQSPAVTHPASVSAPTTPPAAPPTTPRVIGGLVVGKAYPYQLYVLCGVGKISYGGRTWSPVPPVGQPPKNRSVHGQSPAGEYLPGTLTLEQPGILRFTANSAVVASPYSVTFRLSATPINSACIS